MGRRRPAKTWWVRQSRGHERLPGGGLVGLGLAVLGLAVTVPAGARTKLVAAASAIRPGQSRPCRAHAHAQTGVGAGQASCPPEAEPMQRSTGAAQADGAPAPALVEPPVISSQDGVLRTTLTVAEQNVPAGNQTVLGRVYNGGFVGPTLRVRPGDVIDLALANCLTETTNLHFHGLHVTPMGFGDDIFRAVGSGHGRGLQSPASRPITPPGPSGTTRTCTAAQPPRCSAGCRA